MAIFEVSKTYAEPRSTFGIQLLRDIEGHDITSVVETQQTFQDHDDLKQYLSAKLDIPLDNIYVLEIWKD